MLYPSTKHEDASGKRLEFHCFRAEFALTFGGQN